jgi:hypothetical protein
MFRNSYVTGHLYHEIASYMAERPGVHRRHAIFLKTKKDPTALLLLPPPPREQAAWRGQPGQAVGYRARPRAWAPRVFLRQSNGRWKKRRSTLCREWRRWAVQRHPPKPPPRRAGGSHCLGYHLGRAGGWQGPPEGPTERARQPLPRAPH